MEEKMRNNYKHYLSRRIDYANVRPFDQDDLWEIKEDLSEGKTVYVFIYRMQYIHSNDPYIGYGPWTPAFILNPKKQ